MKYRIISKYIDDKLHLYLNLDNGDVYELGQNTDPITLKTLFSALSGNTIGLKQFNQMLYDQLNNGTIYENLGREITDYCMQAGYNVSYGEDHIPAILQLSNTIKDQSDPYMLGITYRIIDGKFYYNTISEELAKSFKLSPELFSVDTARMLIRGQQYTATNRGWVLSTEVNPETDKPYESKEIDYQAFGNVYVGSNGVLYKYGNIYQGSGNAYRTGTIISESGEIIPVFADLGSDEHILVNNTRYYISSSNYPSYDDDLALIDINLKGPRNEDLVIKGLIIYSDYKDSYKYPGFLGNISFNHRLPETSITLQFITTRPDLMYKLLSRTNQVVIEKVVAGVKLIILGNPGNVGNCYVFYEDGLGVINSASWQSDNLYSITSLISDNHPIGVINIDEYNILGYNQRIKLVRSQGKLLVTDPASDEVISEYGQPTVLVTRNAEKAKDLLLDKTVLLIDGPSGNVVSSNKDPNHIDILSSLDEIKHVDHNNYYCNGYINKLKINELVSCLVNYPELTIKGVTNHYPDFKYFSEPQSLLNNNLYDVLDLLVGNAKDNELNTALQNLELASLRVRYTDCYVLIHHVNATTLTEDNVIVGYRYGESSLKIAYNKASKYGPLLAVDNGHLVYANDFNYGDFSISDLRHLLNRANLPLVKLSTKVNESYPSQLGYLTTIDDDNVITINTISNQGIMTMIPSGDISEKFLEFHKEKIKNWINTASAANKVCCFIDLDGANIRMSVSGDNINLDRSRMYSGVVSGAIDLRKLLLASYRNMLDSIELSKLVDEINQGDL